MDFQIPLGLQTRYRNHILQAKKFSTSTLQALIPSLSHEVIWSLISQLRGESTTMSSALGNLCPVMSKSLLHTLRGDATFSLWPVVRKLASADNRSNVLTNHGGRVAEAASLAQPNNVNIQTITNLSLKYLPSNPREHWLWTFDVSLITIMTTLPMF